MKATLPTCSRIIRMRECVQLVGLSRSTIFEIANTASPRHDPSFPRRVRLGSRSVGWFEHELVAWLESKQI